MTKSSLFRSYFLGGFECSTHRTRAGRHLDMLAATAHDRFARQDFCRLHGQGILTARSGVRWHRIETRPFHYDFSSTLPLLRAARETGTQVIWDLCHYGWPDDLDIFSAAFVERFARFAGAFATLLRDEGAGVPFLSPVNEISFFAWAGGEVAFFNSLAKGRGDELKRQLARAALEATEAVWEVLPAARIVHADPVIHVVADPKRPKDRGVAEAYRLTQYQAWDMIAGRLAPELGGAPKYLDILGVNYYHHNQWIYDGPTMDTHHPLYKPFSLILLEVYERYGRPLFVAETGMEGERRPSWLAYIGREVRRALAWGVPVEGICLYPILDYPGWDDERCCRCGLWGYVDTHGERELYRPLTDELARQQRLFAALSTAPRLEVRDKARICLFTDSPDPSGLGEHMLTLAAELRPRFELLFVAGAEGAWLERARGLGCNALVYDHPALTEALRAQRVQLFHAHAGVGWEGHEGVYAARAAGLPVVRTEHLPYLLTDPRQRRDHARLIEAVDRLICVSEGARRSFLAAGLPAEKLFVVRNGVTPQSGWPRAEGVRLRLDVAPERPLILTVARFSEQKGYGYLLAAAREVVEHHPEALFLWVGEGPLRPGLEAQVCDLGLDSSIRFVGRRDDVPQLLAVADLLVLPSLFEGLPLVLLEAFAAGLPVVATDVCGTNEVVTDGVSGRLVEARNPSALAEAVVAALDEPAARSRWSEAGRRRLEMCFNSYRMGEETAALYEPLLRPP